MNRCPVKTIAPWRTREALYSPASFIGGCLWLVAAVALTVAGFNPLGVLMCSVTALLVVTSLVVQAIKQHRGRCRLSRGIWFGLAAQGLPLRITYWLNF
jgi:hypothetical protein